MSPRSTTHHTRHTEHDRTHATLRLNGFCAAALVVLAACGGSTTPNPPVDNFPTPGAGEHTATFSYQLPPGIPSEISNLKAFAGTQAIQLTGTGAGRTNLPNSSPTIIGLAPSGSNQPVSLGVNLGGATGTALSTRSTAEAMGFLVPALVTSDNTKAGTIMAALRNSSATAALQGILDTRFAGSTPEQVLSTADPQVMTTLRTMVNDVLGTTQSPRYDQPARALPASDTPTDRGGVQLTTLAQRDGQGRLQVQLNNGQPRWVAVVKSYSDDGFTWTTPTAENGTFGTMLGAGTAAGQSMQSPVATIPLSPAPYVRIKTFGVGSDLATAYADPDSRFLLGAVTAQGIASVAVPALEPVLATNALHTGGLTWGTGDAGTMQTWATAMMPCFTDPTIMAAIQAGIAAQNMNEAFRLLYSCAMRTGVNIPSVLQGLLSAAGMGNRTAPEAVTRMFNVLSNLGTSVEGAFNTTAIRSTHALNTFDVVDQTRFMGVTSVTPPTGPSGGGTAISITGTNFPTSPVPTVTIGGVAATSVIRVSATQLSAVTGAHAAGLVDVVASAAGSRTATCTGCFTYTSAAVTVTSVTSPFGDVAGGARVAVNGTNFTAGASVTFGGRAGTSVSVVSSTRIDVTVPSGLAIGAVSVAVTPPGGSAVTCANCFVYYTPTIVVTPSTGSLSGGTVVDVTDVPATSLITAVQLAGRPATSVTPLTSTSVRFTTPSGLATGAVQLDFIYGALGTLGCPGCFTYTTATNLGRFSGIVRNAITSNPIAGASVSIRNAGTSTQVDLVTTAADGSYSSNPLAAGSYDLHHSMTGYNNSPLFARTLVGGTGTPVTSLPVVLLVPTGTANGNLTGVVKDATNNTNISGATVEIRNGGSNTSGAALFSTTSAGNGSYSFNGLPAGTYTVRATKAAFSEGTVIATIYLATQTAPILFMSPTGTVFTWRIVLSWGASPSDLDSHLTGPLTGSSSRFHVYYSSSSRGSLIASPFALLDIDVTSGYGPETITIASQIAGVYRYYIYKFSSSGSEIPASSARVDLYQGNTLVRQFYPPNQTGRYWTVFELDGTTITTVNTINDTQPSVIAPAGGPLRLRWAQPGDELRELIRSLPATKSGGGF